MLIFLLAAAAASFAGAATLAAAASKSPPPELRLPLEDLGFPGVSPALLNAGGSMLTIHFVDSGHLLVTFSLRGLVPRLAGDPPGDEDRVVAAELVELPTGKIVARTEWRLHDHGHYLWNLGQGRFLLRTQGSLSTFAPVANLASGNAFLRVALPHRPGNVETILVSSDSKLLTVETSAPQPPQLDPYTTAKAAAAAAAEAAKPHFTSSANEPSPPTPPPPPVAAETLALPPVIVDFYRLSGDGTPASPLVASPAGAFRSSSPVSLPVDGDGYLHLAGRRHKPWALEFHSFNGGDIQLAPIDTSCEPMVKRVGPAQLVSVSCHGQVSGEVLVAYDFERHELWQEPLNASPVPPSFSMAPAAGRFAISRINSIESASVLADGPSNSATQEVRVYQTQTGDLLFKTTCSPIYRTAENFDLAPDGMRVVVVRNGAIEVHRLPVLKKIDLMDLVELQKLAPSEASGPVDLSALADTAAKEEIAPVSAVAAGDTDTTARKPPPSILNPGEKPEFPGKSGPPN